jgi:hypothetical protein
MASSRTNHGESDVNYVVRDGDKSPTAIVSNFTPFFMMNHRQILQLTPYFRLTTMYQISTQETQKSIVQNLGPFWCKFYRIWLGISRCVDLGGDGLQVSHEISP